MAEELNDSSEVTPEVPVKRGRGRPPKNPPVTVAPAKKSLFKRVPTPRSKTAWLILVIFIAALASSAYFYMKYRDTQDKLKNPTAASQGETASLVAKVGKLAELPGSETPTVATVSDVSKLSGQTFFEGAKNGDKVLIYSSAKKAILYRPSTNKIINIAPLNVNNTSSTTGQTGQ